MGLIEPAVYSFRKQQSAGFVPTDIREAPFPVSRGKRLKSRKYSEAQRGEKLKAERNRVVFKSMVLTNKGDYTTVSNSID